MKNHIPQPTKMEEHKQTTLYNATRFNEYPLLELEPYRRTVIDFWELEHLVDEGIISDFILGLCKGLPEVVREKIAHHEGYGITLERYDAMPQQLREALDRQVETLILIVCQSNEENSFDHIPNAVEEFIILCQQLEYLKPVQELYDSLWDEESYHYPLANNSPWLYCFFESKGIELRKGHPTTEIWL